MLSIIIRVLVLISFALAGYGLYKSEQEKDRLHTELIGQQTAFKKLEGEAAQLATKYEDQKLLKELAENRFAEVVKEKNERIKSLSDATFLIGRHVEKQDGPDYYFETPKKTRNFVMNEIRLQGAGTPAIGYILIKSDGRVYKRNYKLEVLVESLQTVDEDTGKIRVITKAFAVQKEPSLLKKRVKDYDDLEGQKIPLEVVGGSLIVDPTQPNQLSPKFFLRAPHLNANVNFGGGDPAYGLSISLSGYGKTKNDLSFKFLDFGVHYNDARGLQGIATPILWRPLPNLFKNTYIGPGVSFDNAGTGFFLGLKLGL